MAGRQGGGQQQPQQQGARPAGALQEGNRWIWAQPEPADFTKWFSSNVHLHDGMEHDRYVQGVVLIGSKEKRKVTRVTQNGQPMITDEERLSFTPYAKVETRVAYFYDLMALHREEWLGVIQPEPTQVLRDQGYFNANMPRGFFRLPIQQENNKVAHYIGCSKRIRILDRSTVEIVEKTYETFHENGQLATRETFRELDGIPIDEFSAGTKMVSTLGRYGEDPFSIMKAETGAAGRALGMAGMLVIPGSGIATAEDMQEAIATLGNTGSVEGVSLEAELADKPEGSAGAENPDKPQEIRDVIKAGIERLESEAPGDLEQLQAWAREKKFAMDNLSDSQARAVERRIREVLTRLDERQS